MVHIFKKESGWKDKNLRHGASFLYTQFGFVPEILRFLANLGHAFKSKPNVRNDGKIFHCEMMFPLKFEVDTSGAVKFYQFKM